MTEPTAGEAEQAASEPTYELVKAPAEGVPPVVRTPEALAESVAALTAGSGPLAVDTERAHGFRYAPKAYLIQLRREGAGTHLIDPIAFEAGAERADLSHVAEALAGVEWILHAATQDLPCLAEVGMLPRTLFDTELAGRLLGLPRVSLTSLTEQALGKTLAKEHSASDWSRRPLPEDWLNYAALDVELLGELRDWVAAELDAAGKTEWATQEFAHLVDHAADPVVRRTDPWRRLSGIHNLRTPRGLAVARELWLTRDEISARLDKAPGRIVPDRVLAELAAVTEASKEVQVGRVRLREIRGFTWRQAARFELNWLGALDRVAAMTKADYPPMRQPAEGPPPPRNWANRYPDAAERWARVRPAITEIAEQHQVPAENLLSPETLRQIAWQPPAPLTREAVDDFLASHGARPWQRALVTDSLVDLL